MKKIIIIFGSGCILTWEIFVVAALRMNQVGTGHGVATAAAAIEVFSALIMIALGTLFTALGLWLAITPDKPVPSKMERMGPLLLAATTLGFTVLRLWVW